MSSLVINPGGTLSPSQVVGRELFIARAWDTLAVQSMALLAPRRLGKTSVCRRMAAEPRTGFKARLRDLEGCQDATELVRTLYRDVSELLPDATRALQGTRAVAERLFGTVEIPWAKVTFREQDWRELLDAVFNDLDRHADQSGTRIVLLWDEFTWFLSDLERNGKARDAMALLDRLRAARQRHTRIRMVFTGSIGLHEVLSALRRHGYGNDPFNDVSRQVLPLLDPGAARALADALLQHIESVHQALVPGREVLAEHMAETCEGHPFLIQHVAQQLKFTRDFSLESLACALECLMEDAADPLELRHYIDRLAGYFADGDLELVRRVLDAIASANGGANLDMIAGEVPQAGRERLIELLSALRQDLYLVRKDGRFSFHLDFLRRYWRLERGL